MHPRIRIVTTIYNFISKVEWSAFSLSCPLALLLGWESFLSNGIIKTKTLLWKASQAAGQKAESAYRPKWQRVGKPLYFENETVCSCDNLS